MPPSRPRAGEQGRSFAVVATEVRNLATRSAQAAREIKTLISSSVQRVEAASSLQQHALCSPWLCSGWAMRARLLLPGECNLRHLHRAMHLLHHGMYLLRLPRPVLHGD